MEVSLGSVFLISTLTSIVCLLPISVNGWGVYEGAFVLLFTQVGVGSAGALSVALLGRVVGTLVSSVGGVLYMIRR